MTTTYNPESCAVNEVRDEAEVAGVLDRYIEECSRIENAEILSLVEHKSILRNIIAHSLSVQTDAYGEYVQPWGHINEQLPPSYRGGKIYLTKMHCQVLANAGIGLIRGKA